MKNKVSLCAKIMHCSVFNLAMLCLFVLCAGIYNYGLHRSFWPDHEYSYPVYRRFLKEYYGLNIDLSGIYDFPAYIPYKLFGCSLKAVRVYASAIYQLIIFFCTAASIYSFRRKQFDWYKLGIFAFIAVILHPGSSPVLGHYLNSYHQYPYDMHAAPVMFATLSVMLLCIHQGVEEQKYKCILKVVIFVVMVMGCKYSDFLYIVGFVGPLICAGLIYMWKKKRKLFYALILGIMAVLAFLHAMSFVVPSLASMFVQSSMSGYGAWTDGSTVYGNTSFADLRVMWKYISNTTVEFLALFNIDIIGKRILSIGMLLVGFRLILVVFMFVCCFKSVINTIKKEDIGTLLDPVDIVLSLGIIFNFFIVMFSAYGESGHCIRYMPLILFYGSVILARQSENIVVKLHGEIDERSKIYFFLFFSLAIVTNMATFWKEDDYVAVYEPAMKNVSSFIMENDFGNGLGAHMLAANLTLLGGGNYAIVDGTMTEEGLNLLIEGLDEYPVTFNYIVDWGTQWFDPYYLYQYLGEPDAVYEEGPFRIYYYAEGFSV